jgi:hypothetical protein
MKYLVLQNFRSYGKEHLKGDVVDESEIRSPLLRISEGKITPAVSSFTAPPVPDTENVDTGERTPEGTENTPVATEETAKPVIKFGHKK